MSDQADLLSFSKASGCGCKLHPAALESLLQSVTFGTHPNLIVGSAGRDDASVMRLHDGKLLIQTTDFFTPLVRNPSDFGRIAAANAISDVYAMGGQPLMANALLGWPVDKLPADWATQMLQAASLVCDEAGIPLAGGHSIELSEPVFGLSVTGTCDTTQLKTNAGARNGDVLILTKPLGTGILAAAHKRNQLDENGYLSLVNTAGSLNLEGLMLGRETSVHAMTDVTGFGLLGHLAEICRASGLGATIQASNIPMLEEARHYAGMGIMPDNTYRNWNAVEHACDMQISDLQAFALLNDPQTNGGLLIAVAPESAGNVLELLLATAPASRIIGNLHSNPTATLVIQA
jgi:selenide, water dikinase